MTSLTSTKSKTYDMVYIALFAVLIAICSWISIPTVVPFTLQTFAIFLSLAVLGGKRGTCAVIVYIPVFSGFKGGIGVLLSTTGGYIIGFIASALVVWAFEKIAGKKLPVLALSMVCGLIVCYILGTAWFMLLYAKNVGPVGLSTVLGWCVIPFIIPDLIKLALALLIGQRISKALPTGFLS